MFEMSCNLLMQCMYEVHSHIFVQGYFSRFSGIKCDGLKAFIAPKMTDFITYLDHHGKKVSHAGSDINDLYLYLEMIGAPTTLTYSSQHHHSIYIRTTT